MPPVVSLEGVCKTYEVGGRPLHVLQDLDLEIAEGEFVSIMGSSGSGKSTLLNIIGILDNFESGTYCLAGQPVMGLSEPEAARIRNEFVGFVFQSFQLLPYKNAVENVALPLFYRGVPRKERNEQALALLDRMGLADWREHLPTELSGGQKQRLAIARALVAEPRLILADEPTGALDHETSVQILDLLEEVNDQGMTVVVVTHEQEIAARTSRVIRLVDGRVQHAA